MIIINTVGKNLSMRVKNTDNIIFCYSLGVLAARKRSCPETSIMVLKPPFLWGRVTPLPYYGKISPYFMLNMNICFD